MHLNSLMKQMLPFNQTNDFGAIYKWNEFYKFSNLC